MPIYLQYGNLIDYVPPTDTSTEDVVFMGGLVGIPQAFIPAGEIGALSVDGVYMFSKKEGVSVNLGDVVKYCGTTKLAQDRNADLPLGVAVADADSDDLYAKVKINSVLPSSGGGGGGGGGDIEINPEAGLEFDCGGLLAVKIGNGLGFDCGGEIYVTNTSGVSIDPNGGITNSSDGLAVKFSVCGFYIDDNKDLSLKVCTASGLDFNSNGELVATGGGGGGGEVAIDTTRGLSENSSGIGINIGSGLSFGSSGELNATGGVDVGCGLVFTDHDQLVVSYGGGLNFNNNGQLMLKVCTASGLSIDNDGYLVYNG